MGHLEPDGAPAGETAPALKRRPRFRSPGFWRPGGLEHPVWPLWWSLKREFALWTAPASWLGAPGNWTYLGDDFVTGLRRNDSTARAFALLDAAPDRFDDVAALAQLNLKRHEQMFQFIALVYVSVPVTIILGLAELMPEGLIATVRANPILVWYVGGLLALGALVYLVGLWRARQLVSVLELWRIERPAGPALRRRPGPRPQA